MKKLFYFVLCCAIASSAFADVTISSPTNGETVGTSFTLSANASWCSGQWIASMGYSIDGSTSTTIVKNDVVTATISPGLGAHTIHVKSWGYEGSVCVADVSVDVTGTATAEVVSGSSSSAPSIPSNAVSVSSLQTLSNWQMVNDTGTGGGYSTGYMNIVGTPSESGPTRQFATNFTNSGAERYYADFGDDTSSTNFVYDGWVELGGNAGSIGNLEMDMNQVMPNGQTVIFGFQCDGYTSTWDYTANAGSPTSPKDVWDHSTAYCNPRNWSRNAWHHVQVWYSRDGSGNVTYHAVWLDGLEEPINATVNSAFALGWAPTLLTNFEVDGLGASGSSNVFLDNLTVYRW